MSTLPGTPTFRVLAAAVEAGVPVLLWGKPGVGKTATMNALASAWGRHIETIVGSNREASDFLGLPVAGEKSLEYVAPDWAHRVSAASKGLVFFDEYNTSPGSVGAAMLRVIQERWVGELQLPDTVAVVAAANPTHIAVNGRELEAPEANRFLHLDWQFDAEAWINGLVSNFAEVAYPTLPSVLSQGSDTDWARAVSVITAFLNTRPDLVAPDAPRDLGTLSDRHGYGPMWAYPSPRTWHSLAKVIARLRSDDREGILLACRGLIGPGAAVELTEWIVAAGLYDPIAVLNGQMTPSWTQDRPDTLFALVQAISAIVTSRRSAEWSNKALDVITSCARAGRKDVCVTALRTVLSLGVRGVTVSDELRAAYADVIVR